MRYNKRFFLNFPDNDKIEKIHLPHKDIIYKVLLERSRQIKSGDQAEARDTRKADRAGEEYVIQTVSHESDNQNI